jgi:hypothetical protein
MLAAESEIVLALSDVIARDVELVPEEPNFLPKRCLAPLQGLADLSKGERG